MFHDLFKRHGTLEVIRGISLQIGRGEVAAIIGPSGRGKSTFLRCSTAWSGSRWLGLDPRP